jgi:hypothetical protein
MHDQAHSGIAGSDTTNIVCLMIAKPFSSNSYQLNGRINVHQVIVMKPNLIQLPEYFFPVPFKICLPMRASP